jgi:RimJ/RimL family protein N-acetyltransferase
MQLVTPRLVLREYRRTDFEAVHRFASDPEATTFVTWGPNTEAARAVLEFGFADLGVRRIWATCRPENVGSCRVLEKIGMIREGHLREHVLIRGEWRDSLLYASLTPHR